MLCSSNPGCCALLCSSMKVGESRGCVVYHRASSASCVSVSVLSVVCTCSSAAEHCVLHVNMQLQVFNTGYTDVQASIRCSRYS
jgi:hypothetical protein